MLLTSATFLVQVPVWSQFLARIPIDVRPMMRAGDYRNRALTATAWAAATLVVGCAAPFRTDYLSGSRQAEKSAGQTAVDGQQADMNDPKTAALRKANGQEPATPEDALQGVLDDLREIGAIDPAAQQQLMADLKQAKPEHYALMVEHFRSTLDYRQQLAQREQAKMSETALAEDRSPANLATLASHEAETAEDVRVAEPRPVRRRTRREEERGRELERPADLPAPRANATVSAPGRIEASRDAAVPTAPYVVAAPQASSWQQHLDQAIVEFKRSSGASPETVAEVQDQMRLRALQLIAGHEDDAFRAIPGTTPAQQDYWAKQLFAMSAYLKAGPAADEKQRAAATLMHLEEARGALAEQATLQVRHLAFVKSVDGFGVYEPVKLAQFQPGEQLSLYAEVENFSCTSTEEGYRTALNTSYQVIDKTGQRVEGGQFPEITDVCRNRRRDFHMQYGVALPKRIYPGEYELELVITDGQSGKIGRAKLPFEIGGGR